MLVHLLVTHTLLSVLNLFKLVPDLYVHASNEVLTWLCYFQFDREKVPERVVHARGMVAKGYFEVQHAILPLLVGIYILVQLYTITIYCIYCHA